MATESVQIQQVLHNIEILSLEDQEYLISVLEKRLIESRRMALKKRAEEAIANYESGDVCSGSIDELLG